MLRIIGDVHGKQAQYVKIASAAQYSLQVGDMGFRYDDLFRLDANHHRVIGGNHDNYGQLRCPTCKGAGCQACENRGYIYSEQTQHFLGDFGLWSPPSFWSVFYIRGAWSIDHKNRIPGISWWPDEELTYGKLETATNYYEEQKPSFVVSHTCPASIAPYLPASQNFGDAIHKTRTGTALDVMWNVNPPKVWVFGHWHCSFDQLIQHPNGKQTRFVCLNELEHKDFLLGDVS